MKRSEAAKFIEGIRRIAATHADIDGAYLMKLLRQHLVDHGVAPLKKCPGEAHSNGYIDNCSLCAPRWGWIGEKVKVS